MSTDPFKQLEERLKALSPYGVPERLEGRIEKALSRARRREHFERWRNRSLWGLFAAAALVMLGLGIALFNGRLASPAGMSEAAVAPVTVAEEAAVEDKAGFRPILAENNLLNRIDEGIVALDNGLTARRFRYEFVDRVVWKNPENGAIVEMEVPRDEVVLVPVRTF